jgi:hypothetical protein
VIRALLVATLADPSPEEERQNPVAEPQTSIFTVAMTRFESQSGTGTMVAVPDLAIFDER